MKVGFVSLGCPKNQLDTEVMLHHVASAGYEITPDEIYEKFQPGALTGHDEMDRNSRELIELNKYRAERDNISVVLVRTY